MHVEDLKRLKRHSIAIRLRRAVFIRDAYRCFYCGEQVSLEGSKSRYRYAVLDHVQPVALGGKNTFENLVTSCWLCNSQKAARDLETFRTYRLDGLRKAVRRLQEGKQLGPSGNYVFSYANYLIARGLADAVLDGTFKFVFFGEEVRRKAIERCDEWFSGKDQEVEPKAA